MSASSGLPYSEFARLDQFARTLGAFRDMQVFRIGIIQLLGSVDPRFQGGVVDTANSFWIGIIFDDVPLKLLKTFRLDG